MRQKSTSFITSTRIIATIFPVILIFIVAMRESSHHDRPYTYLALGDSYTVGEQVVVHESFPAQSVAMLKDKGLNISGPDIVAKTGWTTGELADAIKKAKLREEYDFVTLLIGVNNQYRGRPVAEYVPEFESLLKQAICFAGNDPDHVIVLSIPDWGVTPFAMGRNRRQISAEIDKYNAANMQMSASYKVHYIDITQSTREAEKDISLLTSDGLHPSAKEYAKWAKLVSAIIESKL